MDAGILHRGVEPVCRQDPARPAESAAAFRGPLERHCRGAKTGRFPLPRERETG